MTIKTNHLPPNWAPSKQTWYGNRKTNTEGRNCDSQLWPASYFETPPCTKISPGNNPGRQKKQALQSETTHRHQEPRRLRLKELSEALKQIAAWSTTHAEGGERRRATSTLGFFAHANVLLVGVSGTPSCNQADGETGWTFTCRTSARQNLNTQRRRPPFYSPFRSFVAPHLVYSCREGSRHSFQRCCDIILSRLLMWM